MEATPRDETTVGILTGIGDELQSAQVDPRPLLPGIEVLIDGAKQLADGLDATGRSRRAIAKAVANGVERMLEKEG